MNEGSKSDETRGRGKVKRDNTSTYQHNLSNCELALARSDGQRDCRRCNSATACSGSESHWPVTCTNARASMLSARITPAPYS